MDLSSGEGVSQSDELCLRNFGTSFGNVDMMFTNVASSEVTCEAAEEQAATDACTPSNIGTDVGELTEVLTARFRLITDTACSVGAPEKRFNEWRTQTPVLNMNAGATCRGAIDAFVHSKATLDQRTVAQTDRLLWDTVFVLRDEVLI